MDAWHMSLLWLESLIALSSTCSIKWICTDSHRYCWSCHKCGPLLCENYILLIFSATLALLCSKTTSVWCSTTRWHQNNSLHFHVTSLKMKTQSPLGVAPEVESSGEVKRSMASKNSSSELLSPKPGGGWRMGMGSRSTALTDSSSPSPRCSSCWWFRGWGRLRALSGVMLEQSL